MKHYGPMSDRTKRILIAQAVDSTIRYDKLVSKMYEPGFHVDVEELDAQIDIYNDVRSEWADWGGNPFELDGIVRAALRKVRC